MGFSALPSGAGKLPASLPPTVACMLGGTATGRYPDGAILEFGDLPERIEHRIGQLVGGCLVVAERDEDGTGRRSLVGACIQRNLAAPRLHRDDLPGPDSQALELQGFDEARFREDARAHAVRAITQDLALEAVARTEDIEVTPEELGREVASIAASLGRDPKEVATSLDRSGQIVALAGDIIRSKALDILVEHATVTPEDASGSVGIAGESRSEGAS